MTADLIPSSERFWEDYLLPSVPEFKPLYDDECQFFGEDFLGHIVMSALARFVSNTWKNARHSRAADHPRLRARKRGRAAALGDAEAVRNRELVQRTLAVLEEGLARGEDDLQETILVSFLEDLLKHLDPTELDALKKEFTPNLASGMAAVERFRNQPHWTDDSVPFQYLRWDPVPTDGKGYPQ